MPGELLPFAGLAVIVDQASKQLVAIYLPSWPAPCVALMPRLLLRRSTNGLCFGLVTNLRWLLGLWCIAVLGIVTAVHYLPALHGLVAQAGLGAAIGGASSNLLDRIRHGQVVDFIDLRIWPIFNLADVSILVGSGIALWIPLSGQWP